MTSEVRFPERIVGFLLISVGRLKSEVSHKGHRKKYWDSKVGGLFSNWAIIGRDRSHDKETIGDKIKISVNLSSQTDILRTSWLGKSIQLVLDFQTIAWKPTYFKSAGI